MKMGESDIIKN